MKVGEYFKKVYYGVDTPTGLLVKKVMADRLFVNFDGGTDLKLMLSRRVGRVDPIAIDTSRPVTRSMHRAASQ